ncbi:5'/3'-nucleotidase SurE [Aquirufa aurantiipilula]|uniref:5'-nucleotidase SurE n=1 Tax=Aquirufa aurantiipilula TaxID=2696561 RepID=A0ABT6BGP7_9BACT|nr:5'/3'-nucleotidase SurE [Aquirufa aurantiipilula]MBZ1327712.1 5'/3'-nucleotidase SurE [Aquirufa aurantiipilula]MDF5689633.1 5'/3'-nucleotidase SurE [Aquirufa aurantiipilula]
MSQEKPLILIANDDSIHSKGIRVLTEIMSEIGEVVVVAPDSHQSGMGHAITMGTPIRVTKTETFGPNILSYKCSGTPADCVKFGKHYILKGRKIDLMVSGINHGSNASISVLYSGTMSAAIEAAMEGIPAVGFSLCDYANDADFSHCHDLIIKIAQQVLEHGLHEGLTLNVNFPAKSEAPIQGIRVARQAKAVYREFFEERKDPYGQPYFWMDGFLHNEDLNNGTDLDWLAENYATVVPVKYDLTDYQALEEMKHWDFTI